MTDAADSSGPALGGDAGAGDHPDAPADLQAILARATLAPILAAVAEQRVTGLLAIGTSGEIWLDDGRVYLANGPTSPAPFDVLLGADVATVGELHSMCASADDGGPPVLDQLASCAPDAAGRLARLLHEHNLAAVFELMVPSDDPVELRSGARHVIGSRYAEPAGDLADVATRRLELWRRIAERIPSTGVCFRMARSAPDGVDRVVTTDEWVFLALLDGRRSVADLITETGESAFRVCSLLYRMLLEHLVEPVPATT